MSQDTITHGALQAPTGLAAVVNGDRTVDLSWNPVEGADVYEIHELLVDPAKTLKATVSATTSRRGPLRGGDYRYGVTARNAAGESAMSALVDVHVPTPGEPPQDPGGRQHVGGDGDVPGDVPGHILDLSLWELTLPIANPDPNARDSGPWDVYQRELVRFSHKYFSVQDGVVEYVARVDGVTTSSDSGATRCELREMKGPNEQDKADWTFGAEPKSLTCTLTCDPTGAFPRKECTVGQIHDEHDDEPPPIRLAVDMTQVPGVLRVFPRGQSSKPLLTGLRPDTTFTYRMRVEDGRCRIWAAQGGVDALPSDPAATYERSELKKSGGHVPGKCYFKAGAYNLSQIKDKKTGKVGSGRSVVRHLLLDLE